MLARSSEVKHEPRSGTRNKSLRAERKGHRAGLRVPLRHAEQAPAGQDLPGRQQEWRHCWTAFA